MMKKRIKRIILITVIVLIAISALLTIPSTVVDIKVLGEGYKYYLYDKYKIELRHYIYMSQCVYNEETRDFVNYYDPEDFYTTGFPADEDRKDELIDYDGRKFYITVKCKYNDKEIDIKFEGTKIIADVYTWKMFKNELFPLPDSSLETWDEMKYV